MTSRRAQHLVEMRVALERGCSLADAKAHLARTRHYAGEAALRKARDRANTRAAGPMSAAIPPRNAWWLRD